MDGKQYFEAAATAVSTRQPTNGFYPCPCCDSLSFEEAGGWEICDVCGWEDDPVQEQQPQLAGGANRLCLAEARANYLKYGSSEPPAKKGFLP
jgi:hypothetical protein